MTVVTVTSVLSQLYRKDRLSMLPTSSRPFQHFKENRCKYDGFHIRLCFCIAAGFCGFIVCTPHQSPLCSTIIIFVFITVQLSHNLGAQLSSGNRLYFIDNQNLNLGVVAGADLCLAVYWAIFKLFIQLSRYSGYFTDRYNTRLCPKEFTLKIQGGTGAEEKADDV